jgi:hypothetical protein
MTGAQTTAARPVRMLPTDLGVALVVLLALAAGVLLRERVEGQTRTFTDEGSPFTIAYPATWGALDPEEGTIVNVVNPSTPAVFKTALQVERRDLDPSSLPELQTLIDRRIAERSTLTGYHLVGRSDTTVDGAPAARIDYAYVAQPIDTPGRPALPVVVVAREYLVVAGDTSYYIRLAAPEVDADDALRQFDAIMRTVNLQ